jgi:hypothetical protein
VRTFLLLGVVASACGPGPNVTDAGPKALPANGERIALECETHGVRAYDASRTLLPGVELKCTAHVANRLGTPVNGARVSFLVEAGRVTTAGVTSQTGTVDVVLETATPLPVDVEPEIFSWTPLNDALHTGALLVPTWMVPDRWTENPVATSFAPSQNYTLREPRRPDPIRLKADGSGRFENNPRDNLVTLIAVVDGEEAFSDTNANGTFDLGETFVDLTEPFVDSNDNGTWDEGEQFIDVNGNRRWDGRNGQWDATTKLWMMERVLWTGVPEARDMVTTVPGVGGHVPTTLFSSSPVALTCPGAGPTCSQAQPARAQVYLADPWFNAVTRLGANDDCAAAAAQTLPITVATLAGPGARELWPAGELIEFQLADKRDGTQVFPRRATPFSFTVNFACQFTGEPRGSPGELLLGAVNATIE